MGSTQIMTLFSSYKRLAETRQKTGAIPGVHDALCFDSLPYSTPHLSKLRRPDFVVPFEATPFIMSKEFNPQEDHRNLF
jgi:hypothetical protein